MLNFVKFKYQKKVKNVNNLIKMENDYGNNISQFDVDESRETLESNKF